MTSAPLACSATLFAGVTSKAMVPPVTPIFSAPTSSTALALVPVTMRSPPVLFLNPKLPVRVTNSAICATNPVTATLVTPLATLIGALTATPPMVMLAVVFTFAPVLL